MLTREIESSMVKCGSYWTDEKYGPLRLKLVSTTPSALEEEAQPPSSNSFFHDVKPPSPRRTIKRVFELTHTGYPGAGTRTVVHFQYLEWPDMNVPDDPRGVLGLIGEVKKAVSEGGDSEEPESVSEAHGDVDPMTGICKHALGAKNRPVLLHCSAGVGRTGGFIVVDAVLDAIQREMRKGEVVDKNKMDVDPTPPEVTNPMHVDGKRTGSSEQEDTNGRTRFPRKSTREWVENVDMGNALPAHLWTSPRAFPSASSGSSSSEDSFGFNVNRSTTSSFGTSSSLSSSKPPTTSSSSSPPPHPHSSSSSSLLPPLQVSSPDQRARTFSAPSAARIVDPTPVLASPYHSLTAVPRGFNLSSSIGIGSSPLASSISATPWIPGDRNTTSPAPMMISTSPSSSPAPSPNSNPNASGSDSNHAMPVSRSSSGAPPPPSSRSLSPASSYPVDKSNNSNYNTTYNSSSTHTVSTGVDYKAPRPLHEDRSPQPLSKYEDPIWEVVQDMREQRMSLCQSLRQYVFVHAAVIEGALMIVDEERERLGMGVSRGRERELRRLSRVGGGGSLRVTSTKADDSSASTSTTTVPISVPVPGSRPRVPSSSSTSASSPLRASRTHSHGYSSSGCSSTTTGKRGASPTELRKEDKKGDALLSKRPSIKRKQRDDRAAAAVVSHAQTVGILSVPSIPVSMSNVNGLGFAGGNGTGTTGHGGAPSLVTSYTRQS